MDLIHFGIVSKINAFKTHRNGTIRSEERKYAIAQEIENTGALNPSQPDTVFALPHLAKCGRQETGFYYVENGPDDADAHKFREKALAINNKYVALWPLSSQQRQELVKEQLALAKEFAAKTTHQLTLLVKEDGTFEKLKMRPF